jgi:hypothetical protein
MRCRIAGARPSAQNYAFDDRSPTATSSGELRSSLDGGPPGVV